MIRVQECPREEPNYQLPMEETFHAVGSPRNNPPKQSTDPLDELTIELDDSPSQFSVPDFDLVNQSDPGNKPLDRGMNDREVFEIGEQIYKGVFNPFQFGERAGYTRKSAYDHRFEMLSQSNRIKTTPEDHILSRLEGLPPQSGSRQIQKPSLQMVVEECYQPDRSKRSEEHTSELQSQS